MDQVDCRPFFSSRVTLLSHPSLFSGKERREILAAAAHTERNTGKQLAKITINQGRMAGRGKLRREGRRGQTLIEGVGPLGPENCEWAPFSSAFYCSLPHGRIGTRDPATSLIIAANGFEESHVSPRRKFCGLEGRRLTIIFSAVATSRDGMGLFIAPSLLLRPVQLTRSEN
ncbi:hypothetical protein CEXT_739111 [Caerostris extrusa]|uniref:Uncharacterized protein n=1 Tax=Caerostris extrusa TaxID=172846 RepID=A0AAV4R460_CAEEX|nr:hypothetical protein CEXT_739111 [Caerostris extrusa]